jgi:transcription elongation factor Elf1
MKCPSCDQQFWSGDSLESHRESFHQPTEGDIVEACFECPRCGERRMSHLEFVPPYREELECLACGQVYEP